MAGTVIKKVTFIGICSFICVAVIGQYVFLLSKFKATFRQKNGERRKTLTDFCPK